MRKISFALALLASVSMTIIPVTPSQAASPARSAPAQELVATHAANGNLAVLSPEQMDQLARTNPRLHAKLQTASVKGTVPKLSASEKQLVRKMTAQNMDQIRAGVHGWAIVAIVVGVLFIFAIFTPLGCSLFGWNCGPRAVMARG